jgi:hypothetical protein
MGGARWHFPWQWIRAAATQVGLTKVEMRDGWTRVALPAVEGRGGWTQVGLTAGKMRDGWTQGRVTKVEESVEDNEEEFPRNDTPPAPTSDTKTK